MRIKFRMSVVALFAALVAGCGGGGGGGSDGGFTPPSLVVGITTGQSQTTPRSLVDVLVSARNSNNAPLPNGSTVTVQVSPPSIGVVSFISNGGAGGSAGPIVIGDRVTATVVGGTANLRFHSRAVGTAVITVSMNDPNAPARVVTQTANINVVAGPPSDPRLRIVATQSTLPANTFNVDNFLGSPYTSEATITWRRLSGELVTVFPAGRTNQVNVSVSPVLNTGGFALPDDPETNDINEFQLRLAQAPVPTVAGMATVFFRSLDLPSTSVMTVTALDPDTDETIEASFTFTVVNGSPRLPASISPSRVGNPVYIQGSGGNTAEQITLSIRDGSNGPVIDPVSGTYAYNNYQAEIVGGSIGGDRLRTVNAQGATSQGALIKGRTINGITSFAYEAGTQPRVAQVRITADRADNNVDNGISDPVSVVMTITVGDGKLFDLDITSPSIDALLVNATGGTTSPDGTYSLTIAVIATDRSGNPVVPGTEIRFGSIDHPLQNNAFVISDDDGDPAEGGTGFTDIDGGFTTRGGGVGPGDTLIVFGEEIEGNRDLESARTVQSVNSQSSITVARRFNFNDDTGNSVNYGPILPYVIGRAVDGNIGAIAFTDVNGVARTTLNYPVSKLGKLAAIYAQGNGDIVAGTPELITDAELVRFAGVAGGTLIANPSSIPGNRTVSVDVCYYDGLNNPISGSFVNFSFGELNGGSGRVDGVLTAGVTDEPTGPDGCVTVSVQTAGIVPGGMSSQPPVLTFSVGEATDEVEIITGAVLLSAAPASHSGDGGRQVQLTLTSADGSPVQGAVITGACTVSGTGTLNVSTQGVPTNAMGQTIAIVTADGFDITTPTGGPTGTCTFQTVGGGAMATVTWTSRYICDLFSPQVPQGCPSTLLQLTLGGTGTVRSQPTGLNCNSNSGCGANFPPNTVVTLTATPAPGNPNILWGGDCAYIGTNNSGSVVMPAVSGLPIQCTVQFSP